MKRRDGKRGKKGLRLEDLRRRGTPALRAALALVHSYDGLGDLVIVPRDPSPEMIADGARAGRVAPATAIRIYRAMTAGH